MKFLSKKWNFEILLKLKNKLTRVISSLGELINEITEYDDNITKKRNSLSDKINEADRVKNEAKSYTKGGLVTLGIGTLAAVAAGPFTGGASFPVPVAEVIGIAIIGG